MTNCPKISVVIPTWNAVDTIHLPLDSLKRQSFKNFEVIIIDDNSIDFDMLLTKFKSYDLNGVCRQLPSKGNASICRNMGADIACGELICFLDADDEFHVDKLLTVFCYSKSIGFNDNTIYTHAFDVVTDYSITKKIEHPELISSDHIADYLMQNAGVLQSSSLVVTKVLAKKLRFDESFMRFQDVSFVLGGARLGCSICSFSENSLSSWHINSNYGSVAIKKGESLKLCESFIDKYGDVMGEKNSYYFFARYGIAHYKSKGFIKLGKFLFDLVVKNPIWFVEKVLNFNRLRNIL